MIAFVDGRYCEEAEASVSVLDRGLLHGDSIFATLRGEGGRPVFLEDHLARLESAAARFEIPFAPTEDPSSILQHLLAQNAPTGTARIRITITRGPGEILARAHPIWIVTAVPHEVPLDLYRTGVSAAILKNAPDPWIDELPAKTGSWLGHARARRWAHARSAYEAIRLGRGGCLVEGSSSTLFWTNDGRLETPARSLGVLPGVTREKVFALASADGEVGSVFEVESGADVLFKAREVFLASSLVEVLPVTQIDGQTIGDGVPGPVARRLRAALRALYPGKEIP